MDLLRAADPITFERRPNKVRPFYSIAPPAAATGQDNGKLKVES